MAACPGGWVSSCVPCPWCLHHQQLPEIGQGLAGPKLAIPVWSGPISSQAPLSECLTDTEWAEKEGMVYAVLVFQKFCSQKDKYSIWTSIWVFQFINSGVLHLVLKSSYVITITNNCSFPFFSLSQNKSVHSAMTGLKC